MLSFRKSFVFTLAGASAIPNGYRMTALKKLLRVSPIIFSAVALAVGLMSVRTLQDQRDLCTATKAWFRPEYFSNIDGMLIVFAVPWAVLAGAHYLTRERKHVAFDIWSVLTIILATFFIHLNLQALAAPVASQQLCDSIYFVEFNEAARLALLFLVFPYVALSTVGTLITLLLQKFCK